MNTDKETRMMSDLKERREGALEEGTEINIIGLDQRSTE